MYLNDVTTVGLWLTTIDCGKLFCAIDPSEKHD